MPKEAEAIYAELEEAVLAEIERLVPDLLAMRRAMWERRAGAC